MAAEADELASTINRKWMTPAKRLDSKAWWTWDSGKAKELRGQAAALRKQAASSQSAYKELVARIRNLEEKIKEVQKEAAKHAAAAKRHLADVKKHQAKTKQLLEHAAKLADIARLHDINKGVQIAFQDFAALQASNPRIAQSMGCNPYRESIW